MKKYETVNKAFLSQYTNYMTFDSVIIKRAVGSWKYSFLEID